MEKLSILICSIPNPFEQKLDVCNTSIVYREYHKALSIVEKLEFSSESKSHLVVSDSLQPHGLYSPWNSPGKNTGVGSLSLEWEIPSSGYLPNPGIEPRSTALQAVSLPAEPQGKPKNTGVGHLFIF